MALCIILFMVLIVYRRRIPDKKIFRILVICNAAATILFVLAWVRDGSLEEIERKSYGEGSITDTYLVSVEGELEDSKISLEVAERSYTKDEVKVMFSEVMDILEETVLGENRSRDRVTKDLVLPGDLEEYPVQIQWEMDRYDVLDGTGKLIRENLTEEAVLVELRGLITYQEEEAVYVTTVSVCEEEKTGEEKWISEIEELVEKEEKESREAAAFALPKMISGKNITWRRPADHRGYVVLTLGIIVSILLYIQRVQDAKEFKQKRTQQMTLDYPNIVSEFAMLLAAGMTVKNTWNRIVRTYEEEKKSGKNRFAYEEMCLTSREMQGGVSEQEAYERFGKRCGQKEYIKFSMLLSQNLRKGSRGLSEILKIESMKAFEERKQHAKKRGEEASTKLLLPMFLMFAIVLLLVMIPAFLSIQL